MAGKKEYLEQLRTRIEELHKCSATYRRTVPVHEEFKGKTVWKGDVEVFWLTGHAQAKRCYAWAGNPQDPNSGKVTAILEVPPVIGPATAVRTALAAETKSKK